MRKYDAAVIDFETMNSKTNSPCEIGITLINDLEIVSSYSSYINPKSNYYSLNNAEIHNIPKETILNAPSFDIIYKDIKHYLRESQIIIAHNANFDISVLKSTLSDYNINFPNFLYIDSVRIFKNFLGGISLSMKNLCEFYGISKEGLHSAKVDAEKLAEMLIILANENNFNSLLEMIQSTKKNHIKFSKFINSIDFLNKNSSFQKSITIKELNKVKPTNFSNPHISGKNIVFSGKFKNGKDVLQVMAKENNAVVSSSVNKSTNILVEGIQEKRYVDENGLVSKQRKARELISQGFEISLVNEEEFLRMIGEFENDQKNNY
ncbi:3'-5' exoribonuclease [Staphylococcus sp. IVB6181]|uniref:exonuclease domain-containing protein n=1 Tax=Staphylococcus sp. IVB6181 TaxID=2929481 RepID=UPI0021D07CF7|nr:exonuclease domain-containing protein [Staphylococcus sp. IVB6181]UXV34531.1 3'-5' exoribonuclease [Staphylococcus sp. IVB6181]